MKRIFLNRLNISINLNSMKNTLLLICFFPLHYFAQKNLPYANKKILTQVVAKENKVKVQKLITIFPSSKDTVVTVVEFDTNGKVLHKTVTSKLNKQHEIDCTNFFYDSDGKIISSVFVHGKMVDSMFVISQSPDFLSRTYRDGKLIAWDEKKSDSANSVETKVTISGGDTTMSCSKWKLDYDKSGKLLKNSFFSTDKKKGKIDTTFYRTTDYYGKSDSTVTFNFFSGKNGYVRTTSQHDSIQHTRTYFHYDEKGKYRSSSIEHLDSLNRVATRNLVTRIKMISFTDIYHYDGKGHYLGYEAVSGRRNKPFYQVIDTYNSEGLLSEEKVINVKKVESDVKYEYEFYQK